MALRSRLAALAQFYGKIVLLWVVIAWMLVAATLQTAAHIARQVRAAVASG